MLPVANTQLGPGSLAACLGGRLEGGEDTIWIHPDPDFNDKIVFDPEHPNYRHRRRSAVEGSELERGSAAPECGRARRRYGAPRREGLGEQP